MKHKWLQAQRAMAAANARQCIRFGMQLIAKGAAWIDNISMDFAAIAK
jgi:hypothetical protein